MSIYIQIADVVAAFGQREVDMIADRDNDGVYEAAVVQSHIEQAEQQINFAVGQRCALPLVSPAPEILGHLAQWALDITRYRLTGSSGITVTSDVEARYKETREDLERVTSGKIVLCAQGLGSNTQGVGGTTGTGLLPSQLTPGEAEVVDTADDPNCCREWTRHSLRDFMPFGRRRGSFGNNGGML